MLSSPASADALASASPSHDICSTEAHACSLMAGPRTTASQPWGAEPGGTEGVARELGVAFIEADFADPAAPAQVIAAARDALGPLDFLIVNHARSGRGPLGTLTAEKIDAFLHENVRASLLLVQEFAAQHDDSRGGGRVILFTSGQHLAPMSREVAYAVSKGALHQATRTLADELGQRGITANTVNPGPTDTGWASASRIPADPCPSAGGVDQAMQRGSWCGSVVTTPAGSQAK
jgi:3-oxoacyl-[acyl-carrier protein] reductase